MIAIGSFLFPVSTTMVQTGMVEAKSKVRKEIRIQSMLTNQKTTLPQDVAHLREMVERLDRRDAVLSLEAGRFMYGRRRHFSVAVSPDESLAWVDLTVLSEDRYERSQTWHEHAINWQAGSAVFSVFNLGNWLAPCVICMQPPVALTRIAINDGERDYVLETDLDANKVLRIDSEQRQVTIDGEQTVLSLDEYPMLSPGENTMTVSVVPEISATQCRLGFRDFWV
jgi:hypothetical protein